MNAKTELKMVARSSKVAAMVAIGSSFFSGIFVVNHNWVWGSVAMIVAIGCVIYAAEKC